MGPVEVDVLVIGAGVAGCLIAVRLAERGVRVLALESGGARQLADTHPLNAVEQTGNIYAGAETGRFRCLGGTSTRWGGAMIPFLPEDTGPHTAGWVDDWRLPWVRLLSHLDGIERRFRLPPGPYEDHDLLGSPTAAGGFIARTAKWPPFRLRNVAVALDAELQAESGPEVWLNAHVTGLALDEAGRVVGARVAMQSGSTVVVQATETVLAAGAIESTRLLLLLDRQHACRIFAPDDVLGRHFNDHLSARIARLAPRDRLALNRVVGFRFEKSAMRNVRFEMTGPARAARRLPAGFTHIAYEGDVETGGFSALRAMYRAMQSGRWPGRAEVFALVRDAPWLARAVWWRYAEGRLLYPARGTFSAHLVAEQMPRRENCITLSEDRTDLFGQPLARIHWSVGEEDARAFGGIAEAFTAMWSASPLNRLARIEPIARTVWEPTILASGGVFHPAGTVRIGTGPTRGVVDAGLATFRISSLHVVSTAVFPVVGGANPTLMMMLYACDVADRLAARLGRH